MIRLQRLINFIIVLLVIPASTLAQSADELKSRFGPPFEAYEIQPGIMMTVRLDENGQALELRVERRAATEFILPNVAKKIVDELVPEDERGPKGNHFGLVLLIGAGATTFEDYENVSVSYHANQPTRCADQSPTSLGGIREIVIKWKRRPPPLSTQSAFTGNWAPDPSFTDSQKRQPISYGISGIANILVSIAGESDYSSVKPSVLLPDEWNTNKARPLLLDHAYYILMSRDPQSLLDLGPMHDGASSKRINSTVLVFKHPEAALRELARLRDQRLDIGATVIRSDSTGFEIRTVMRSYCAVRHGAGVVLLETRDQHETIKDLADKLAKAEW